VTPRVNRRTKIVATIGPGSESEDMIARLISAGVNVFRLNFSHGSSAQHAKVAQRIRKQAGLAGLYVGILADLQGPKIRDTQLSHRFSKAGKRGSIPAGFGPWRR
jgi:pyruvate kinase